MDSDHQKNYHSLNVTSRVDLGKTEEIDKVTTLLKTKKISSKTKGSRVNVIS